MAFKVDIYTQNMENTDRINEYVNKKVSKLDHLLKDIEETQIDLSYVKSARNLSDRQVAQITIRGKGFILRSEERAADIFTAIDNALDKVHRQIERFKGKRSRVRDTNVADIEIAAEKLIDEEDEIQPLIARRKEFTMVPMDEMEAIEQMALLGHEDFFVFCNANTSDINVLYRRRNGTYGLIIPKIG